MAEQFSFEVKLADAAFVAGYLKRLVDWDARASVRVQRHGNAFGLYGAPPLGCLSLIVVPIVAAGDPAAFDVTVSAGRMRDVLGDVSGPARKGPFDQLKNVRIPDGVTGPRELAQLPPEAPWRLTGTATARELLPIVEGAIKEFRRRAPDAPINPTHAQHTADDIWGREAWAGLPLRSLHAARSFGFLGNEDAPIEAATSDGWQRLVSPAGRVFTNTTIGLSTFNLTVI